MNCSIAPRLTDTGGVHIESKISFSDYLAFSALATNFLNARKDHTPGVDSSSIVSSALQSHSSWSNSLAVGRSWTELHQFTDELLVAHCSLWMFKEHERLP